MGFNPYGFFCDEALYGLRSYLLWQGNFKPLVNPFFYEHFGYLQGTLFIFAPLLLVKLLGLSEFSVRLTSVVFMLLTLVVIWETLRTLKIRYPWVPVLIFGLTPIIIHISRIYFGMTPSMFFMALGYYLYIRSRRDNKSKLGVVAGLVMGLAIYGYSSFQVTTILLFIAILITEILGNRLNVRKYKGIACLLVGLILAYMPFVYTAVKEPIFFKRLHDKNNAFTQINAERINQLMRNYPKYFSPIYLFIAGEKGMPGVFIDRHSVIGAGLLLKSSVVLAILFLIKLFFIHDKRLRFFLPFFFLIFLYPIPDLMTTTDKNAPYTFPASGSFILLPFVFAFGWELWVILAELFKKRFLVVKYFLIVGMLGIGVVEAGLFYIHQYQEYPLGSSDYWGWQAGPREMIAFFKSHSEEYDHFYMQGEFNEPQVFLDFYLIDSPLRKRASIASPLDIEVRPKTLFAVAYGTYTEHAVIQKLHLVNTVVYPNGKPSFYLVDLQN